MTLLNSCQVLKSLACIVVAPQLIAQLKRFLALQALVEDIPFLDTFPKPQGEGIVVAVYRKPTQTDRYLDFHSSHPVLAKRAVVRALMDRAENVCSDPDILAKEMEHLNKVLCYNNYPQWMINQ